MQSFISSLHELPDEIRNEMFMRRFLGRMDSRQEMRGHGLDMTQWEARSSTPEEISIQKNHEDCQRDELYWWLHYHKLQDIYVFVKGYFFIRIIYGQSSTFRGITLVSKIYFPKLSFRNKKL